MNATKIEWVQNPDGSPGYTWNPVTGCLNHANGMCKGGGFPCYAYRLANGRLRERYLANDNVPDGKDWEAVKNPFYPRFWPERLTPIYDPSPRDQDRHFYQNRKDKGIFVCDMSDLFGIGIPEHWTYKVLEAIRCNSRDRFYLLTKQPQNLIKFSPFPDNCWVGVTVTSNGAMTLAMTRLSQVQAKVKFISFEPLLGSIGMNDHMSMKGIVDWVIIGSITGALEDIKKAIMVHPQLKLMPYGKRWTLQPRIEWVREIVEAADKAGIPVFLKDNLRPYLKEKLGHLGITTHSRLFFGVGDGWILRQETPQC
jgi:protein gp37